MASVSSEEKIRALGLKLPAATKPLAAYVPTVKTGNLVFCSGQLPMETGKLSFLGKIGKDLTLEQGQKAAELCLLNALAAIKAEIGDLDKISKVVRLNGFVNSADGFTDQHLVVNRASELLVQILGDKGKHSRIAVGVAELPLGAGVELDLIVEAI